MPTTLRRDGLRRAVVLAGPGLEELFLSRAVTIDLGVASVPFISPEDLVVTKILAGRPKDLDDVAGVLCERGVRLDIEAIRTTLTQLEQALGQSDLIVAFDAQLAQWRRGPQLSRRWPDSGALRESPDRKT